MKVFDALKTPLANLANKLDTKVLADIGSTLKLLDTQGLDVMNEFSQKEINETRCLSDFYTKTCRDFYDSITLDSSTQLSLKNTGCSVLLKNASADGFESCLHGKFLASHLIHGLQIVAENAANKVKEKTLV